MRPRSATSRKRFSTLSSELPGPGLLYTATRREAEAYAAELGGTGLRAAAYHAGLSARARSLVHDAFLDDEFDVVVATNAFGMGIDKPNVRFVVHASVPDSLDAYYQEVGRAGRDGEPASAMLFYRSEDLGLRKYFAARSVDRERVVAAYEAVVASDSPVRAKDLAASLDISPRAATGLLNLLAEGGAIVLTRRGAARPHEPDERPRQRMPRKRLPNGVSGSRNRAWRSCGGTPRRGTAGAACCSDISARTCLSRASAATGVARVPCTEETLDESLVPYPTGAAVDHVEWGRGSVVDVESDRVTVFFEDQGYKVLALQAVEENALLRRVN